jgi:hypothetical protein
VFNTKESRGSN